jgi:hypothetical protein
MQEPSTNLLRFHAVVFYYRSRDYLANSAGNRVMPVNKILRITKIAWTRVFPCSNTSGRL